MFNRRSGRMRLLPKAAREGRAHALVALYTTNLTQIQSPAGAMVSINAPLGVTVLSISAWIQSRQVRDRFYVFVRDLVVMLELAVGLGARPAEIVVIAKLVAAGAQLDAREDGRRDVQRRVESAGTWVPVDFRMWRDDS